MPVSLLLATVALGQGGAVPNPVERWAAWLVAHTSIAKTSTWTRPTWRLYPSAQLDPGYLSPKRDRILRLDGWIGAFRAPRGEDDRVVLSLGPNLVAPGGAGEAAILLAQGRREAAVALVRTLSPESVDKEIGRAVTQHVWMRYSRAMNIYNRGRDREALAIARSLATDLPGLRAVLAAPPSSRSSKDPFEFVNGLGGLMDELAQRLREPKPEIGHLSKASVADLVSGLREITGGFRFNGGRSHYQYLPIVRELGRRGNAAVPLLLQNLESNRLTRDVWNRDYSYTIEIASVFRPTIEALNQIAGTHGLPGVEPTDAPAKIVSGYRAFFAATAGMNRSQRALYLLDTTTDGRFWLDAAKTLLESGSARSRDTDNLGSLTPLERDRAVARLDARFDEAIGAPPPRASTETLATMAIARTALNPIGASVRLERATDASLASLRRGESLYGGGNEIAKAFRLRMLRGDVTAIPQYDVWIRLMATDETRVQPGWLAPLDDLDASPALDPTARWVFEAPESAYVRDGYETLAAWKGDWRNGIGRLPRRLRLAFAQALTDVTPVGIVRHESSGASVYDYPGTGSYVRSYSSDRDGLKPGESQAIRRCDRVAENLSSRQTLGVAFESFWPLARRDAAIAEMKSRLAL